MQTNSMCLKIGILESAQNQRLRRKRERTGAGSATTIYSNSLRAAVYGDYVLGSGEAHILNISSEQSPINMQVIRTDILTPLPGLPSVSG